MKSRDKRNPFLVDRLAMARAFGLSLEAARLLVPRSRRTLIRWEQRPDFERRVDELEQQILTGFLKKLAAAAESDRRPAA
jgi:hypothetical protein